MSFSSYLVGSWENGRIESVASTLQIINPTTDYLRVIVAFFDDKEKPLRLLVSEIDHYRQGPLSPNDMWEIIVSDPSVNQPERPVKGFGVVKIISLYGDRNAPGNHDKRDIVKEGIVGFQRIERLDQKDPLSEAPLAAVPCRYAQTEYYRIMNELSFP